MLDAPSLEQQRMPSSAQVLVSKKKKNANPSFLLFDARAFLCGKGLYCYRIDVLASNVPVTVNLPMARKRKCKKKIEKESCRGLKRNHQLYPYSHIHCIPTNLSCPKFFQKKSKETPSEFSCQKIPDAASFVFCVADIAGDPPAFFPFAFVPGR